MNLYKTVRLAAVALLPALLLAGCNLSLAADVTPPPGYRPPSPQPAQTAGPVFPLTPPNPQNGAPIYVEKCAPCHGVNGLGDGPQAAELPNQPAALGSLEIARPASPAAWFRIVTEGNLERFMPPFNSLNEQQRWDVVAYALTLSAPPEQLSQGREVYDEACAGCHGPAGKGDGPQAPTAMPDFTNQERMVSLTGEQLVQVIDQGVPGKMPAFAEQLSEDQRWAAAAYARSLGFASLAEAPAPVETAAPLTATLSAPVSATTPVTSTQPISANLTGVISGTVVVGAGGAISQGAQVNLHAFDGMQLAMTATTTLNDQGVFRFDNIEIPAGRAFLATVDYDNVLYGSDVAQAESAGQPISLTIQVYPSTTEQTGLSVDRLHFFFELVNQDTLRVAELYIISNNSGKTIIGDALGQPVLRFSLPQGAQNLQFQEGQLGERFLQTAEGFADTQPLRPGSGAYQVLYSYELPYKRKLDLTRPIQWDTGAVVVLAPETGLSVQSDALEDGGSRDIQGTAYHTYNGAAMPAGSALKMTVSGKLDLTGNLFNAGSSSNLLVGGAALGLVLVLVGVWLYTRSRNSQPSEPAPSAAPAGNDLPDTEEGVMDAILALDDLYQDGQLPEDAYRERRADLKARLAQLKER